MDHGAEDLMRAEWLEVRRAAEALAAAAGIAIDNARLYEQARARQSWIAATRDIATELLRGAEPGRVFRLIADEALATSIVVTDALEGASATTLDGHELLIRLQRA